MAVEAPIPVAPTPVPAPQRGDRANFSLRYDAHITWQIGAVPQFNALAVNVSHNAADASTSAETAATQAGIATAKAAAALASAAAAAASASSADNFRNYAADSAAAALASQGAAAGSATSAQTWATAALAAAALAGVPSYSGNARKSLCVNAAGTGLEFVEVVTRVVTYASRANLRTIETFPTQYLVRGLGLFEWISGSIEPDDDATCFRTAAGAWTMIAADPDFGASLWETELPTILRGSFSMTLTTLSTGAGGAFVVNLPGATPGDAVIVTPGLQLSEFLSISSSVESANVVRVAIGNPSAATRAMTPSTWTITIIKA